MTVIDPHDIRPCKYGCDKTTVILIRTGRIDSGKYVVECSMCQHSSPVLPLEEAIAHWNEHHGLHVTTNPTWNGQK